jgi:hypothetical protein
MPTTRVLVLIAKPPAASVAAQLAREAAQTGSRVLAFVGNPLCCREVYLAATLEEAAPMAECWCVARPCRLHRLLSLHPSLKWRRQLVRRCSLGNGWYTPCTVVAHWRMKP